MADSEPFDVCRVAGVTVAVFRNSYAQIDESQMEIVNRSLMELGSIEPPALVLDLSHVEFFGSSFIEAMFRVWKRLQGRSGAQFAICGLKPYCREVLEITHLDKLWPMYATRDEALAHVRDARRSSGASPGDVTSPVMPSVS